MFGGLFFDHRVLSRLMKNGWTLADVPRPQEFAKLCGVLRSNGYDVERAAQLWEQVLKEELVGAEREATKRLRQETGLYGVTAIDENGAWR